MRNVEIGENCIIGAYTEIGPEVKIGNKCRIQARCFIPKGVVIEDNVFIGPGVIFCNVRYPKVYEQGEFEKTIVQKESIIGAGCIILPGIIVGEGALIGAGTIVTKDVEPRNIYFNKKLLEKITPTDICPHSKNSSVINNEDV